MRSRLSTGNVVAVLLAASALAHPGTLRGAGRRMQERDEERRRHREGEELARLVAGDQCAARLARAADKRARRAAKRAVEGRDA